MATGEIAAQTAAAASAAVRRSKVATIRGDLIGGERANDVQLRERHRRKKAAAERRMRWERFIRVDLLLEYSN